MLSHRSGIPGGGATPGDLVLRTCLEGTAEPGVPGREEAPPRPEDPARLGCLEKDVIQALITQLKGQNEEQRMDTLRGLRIALSSWAAVPKDKVIGRSSVTRTRQDTATDGAGLGFGQGEGNLAPHFHGEPS